MTKTERSKRKSKPLTWKGRLGLVTFGLGLGFGSMEMGVRLDHLSKYDSAIQHYLSGQPLFEPKPKKAYEYITRPNLRIDSEITGGKSITTDDEGFRVGDKEENGFPMVHFYGDSFTFGIGVGDQETFPHLLGNSLEINDVNFGVSGYNTIQESALMEEHFKEGRIPDAVVLSYFLNDPQPPHNLPRHPQHKFANVESWAIEEFKFQANDFLNSRDISFRFNCKRQIPSFDLEESFSKKNSKWKRSKSALIRIRDLCDKNEVPLLVAILPSCSYNFVTEDSYYPGFVHQKVEEYVESLGAPCVDVLPAFLGNDGKDLAADREGHPNTEGHRIIANYLEPRIRRLIRLN